jgi:hypothetical protein
VRKLPPAAGTSANPPQPEPAAYHQAAQPAQEQQLLSERERLYSNGGVTRREIASRGKPREPKGSRAKLYARDRS